MTDPRVQKLADYLAPRHSDVPNPCACFYCNGAASLDYAARLITVIERAGMDVVMK